MVHFDGRWAMGDGLKFAFMLPTSSVRQSSKFLVNRQWPSSIVNPLVLGPWSLVLVIENGSVLNKVLY